ncbi:MAG: glycosyltransferase family 9 protein [Bacteroidales bacterium]|nr:glycosyltransferase family 9 protein [Bacteroidales bacterium]
MRKDLPHTVDRYRDVFSKAGFSVGEPFIPAFSLSGKAEKEAAEITASSNPAGHKMIAVSPFAKHRTKMWPLGKMESLMALLTEREKVFFMLFGGRDEAGDLELLAGKFPNSLVVAGGYDLQTELALISRMQFMISMDSSNMHMAALSGIPTVSIWGGTHPDTGFAPVGDQGHIIIQTPNSELGCRPCSVYGAKPCIRKDVINKCLEMISPGMVAEDIKRGGFLGNQSRDSANSSKLL